MKPDNERFQIDSAAGRLMLWSKALDFMAQEEIASQLVPALEAGDRERLEALLEPTGLFQAGFCIDIYETITKIINFGPARPVERCEVVQAVPLFSPSEDNGRVYRLPDGTYVFVSDKLWFDYHKRAAEDPAWREANISFLKALGILRCYTDWVPNSKLVSIDRSKTLCFPPVVTPY